jgi:hypothetical protein
MASGRSLREPGVPLIDILESNQPLPSAMIGDATFITRTNRLVKLRVSHIRFYAYKVGSVAFCGWRAFRELYRKGSCPRELYIQYEGSLKCSRVPLHELEVATSWLNSRPISVSMIQENVVKMMRVTYPDGCYIDVPEKVTVVGLGINYAELYTNEQTFEHSESTSTLFLASDAKLIDLDERLNKLQLAQQAIDSWRSARKTLAELLPGNEIFGIINRDPWRENKIDSNTHYAATADELHEYARLKDNRTAAKNAIDDWWKDLTSLKELIVETLHGCP